MEANQTPLSNREYNKTNNFKQKVVLAKSVQERADAEAARAALEASLAEVFECTLSSFLHLFYSTFFSLEASPAQVRIS